MWNYKNQKESSRSCFAGCSGIFQVFVCKGSHQVSHMPGPANLRDQRMDGSGVCVDGRNRQRSSSKSADSYREKHSDEGEAELIEQFEPGVYVTIVQLRNETKVFKRVRFSKRRFANQQAEEWWKANKKRVLKKYSYRGTLLPLDLPWVQQLRRKIMWQHLLKISFHI